MECNHTATGSLLWMGTVIAPMPLSSIGLVMNILFVGVIFYGQYIGRLRTNLYYFLLNRAFGDIITSFSMLLVRILLLAGVVDVRITTVGFFGLSFSFVASAVSYLCLSAIKLTAVKWPFLHLRYVTRRIMFSVLIATWVVALLLSSVELTFLMSFFRFVSIVNCDTDDCIRILEILAAGTSAIIYISVVGLYVWMLYTVKKSERAAPRSHNKQTSKRKICQNSAHSAGICVVRLGANVMTYMIMCSMEAPGTWTAISLSPMYRENGNCIFNSTEQASEYHSTVIFSVICCTIFLLRIIVDPLVNCLIDRKLRTLFCEIFLRRKQPIMSRTDTAISTSASVRDINRIEKSG
jgi:hypothetical protein